MLVLDSGGVSHLAARNRTRLALVRALRQQGLWPPVVPTVVLVECLTGQGPRDAAVHRVLTAVEVVELVPLSVARRAASLRAQARRGSAVDALVVALAEPGGTVMTADGKDVGLLAELAQGVAVELV